MSSSTLQTGPLALIILDGFGISNEVRGNAIKAAHTPILNQLQKNYPHSILECSGEAVGLPMGQMGNSEVGHLNMGAGRIVYQELTRINKNIATKEFFYNPILLQIFKSLRNKKSSLHLLGLISDGGVHSHLSHLFALIEMAQQEGIEKIYVHGILDGRDTPPKSALTYLAQIAEYTKRTPAKIATIIGRYYAMDRDNRWDRIQRAYQLLVSGEGRRCNDAKKAIDTAYSAGESDEFVTPILINPEGLIKDDDAVIFFNFRADRARQITKVLTHVDFDKFPRNPHPHLLSFASMTQYDDKFNLPILFPPVGLKNILGKILSERKIPQLRIAETEKYAHVTFFFNGGEEKPFPGEERCLIPSPTDIPTYDLKPQMSAPQVTAELVNRIRSGSYQFFVLNLANTDMVGHTGNFEAAVKAVEAIDQSLGNILQALKAQGGEALITADHGNVEQMIDLETMTPHTAHTTNPVPFILFSKKLRKNKLKQGIHADIMPTILELINIPSPPEVTGGSLLL